MEDSVTLRDPRLEARAAGTAYAQARAILESEPQISAAELVDRLRRRAEDLAGQLDARAEVPPPTVADREPSHSGLGAAAAEARERRAGAAPSPSPADDEETWPN